MTAPDAADLLKFTEDCVRSHGLTILQKSYAELWASARAHGGPAEAWLDQFRTKGCQLVTRGEVAFEGALRTALSGAFPDVRVWGEELGDEAASGDAVIAAIDPVDGTASMLASIVQPERAGAYGFGVSVGWIRGGAFWGGQIFVLSGDGAGGLACAEVWSGFEGGATLKNGAPVTVPEAGSDTLYCTAPRASVMFPGAAEQRAFWALERAAVRVVADLNCVGFLRAIEQGATAAERDLSVHDVAALVPIARAAGMAVSDFDTGAALIPDDPARAYTIHMAPPAMHAAQRTAIEGATEPPPAGSVLFDGGAPMPHARKF